MKLHFLITTFCLLCCTSIGNTVNAQDFTVSPDRRTSDDEAGPSASWRKILLSGEFFSEGADAGDINGDGVTDIVSGPYWYQGPDYRQRHAYTRATPFAIAGYSDHFLTFVADINRDSWDDILVVAMPGEAAVWFENPGRQSNDWSKHVALSEVSNESPAWTDLTGDGQPELVCIHHGAYGYASPGERPEVPWRFVPVTPNNGYGRFTHGLGVGDVDGDGRADLLEKDGWWQQGSEGAGALFQFHRQAFAATGGSQMFACDLDGDGDNDVVSVRNAHGWGLTWFEHRRGDNGRGFIPHVILPDRYDADADLNLSQMHALALADIDGDGVPDLVTGKRFYAHGGRDPGALQPAATWWFRTVREAGDVRFEPHLIHPHTGVGTQLTVRDLTNDGRPDVLVANKLGTALLVNPGVYTEAAALPPELRLIGTPEFAQAVRSTQPQTPDAERRSFVVPHGFDVQLVASEPQIAKPMNMAFDSDGRLWVTTSEEYPYAAPADRPSRDRIVVLEDTDGDGHRESARVFADALNIPMGLYPWRDGVICFSIPNIWFLRDTDNDGRADVREKLYGPMGFERDTHGLCNGFRRGFDGWLYACHGFNNHTTVAGRDGHRITMQSGNIFRMRPDGSRVEIFTHGLVNPFGMTLTTTGDLLVADCHTRPVNLLLPGGYYDSFGKPHDGLGYVPNVMEHLHGSTAIAGIVQYNADRFPEVYRGHTFGGNVMTGRINRNSLRERGSGYQAREEPDLLISGDPWFRPVDLQLGPDGALYVADFYNRIIGHYEVGLDHPGRDRHRGRIWKIVYRGHPDRRDAPPSEPGQRNLPAVDVRAGSTRVARLWRDLYSSNLAVRSRATDDLTDEFPDAAAELALRSLQQDTPSETVRTHALWILHRTNRLPEHILVACLQDESFVVRVHAFRVLADRPQGLTDSVSWLLRGIQDEVPMVRRPAVHAAAVHRHSDLPTALIRLYNETPPDDVHLRHSIRMTVRDHLQDERLFRRVAAAADAQQTVFLADICLALKSEAAGEFLVANLNSLNASRPEQFAEYVRHAARYVNGQTVGELAGVARQQYADDPEFQLLLLQASVDGLRQRGSEIPDPVRDWAADVAGQLLQLKDGRLPPEAGRRIPWTWIPHPEFPEDSIPFTVSRRRHCADGAQNVPLFSSYPKGEQRTGIYRSGVFRLKKDFHFWMAGHHGFPDTKGHGKNYVQLKDAVTHRVVQRWHPPRNDTAQRFTLTADPKDVSQAYVEIVDGDTAGAFAWLAVGRFSESGLNPEQNSEYRQQAVNLIADLRLNHLRPVLHELLRRQLHDPEGAKSVAAAIARFHSSAVSAAVAAAIGVRGLTPELRGALAERLIRESPEINEDKAFAAAVKSATFGEQSAIAEALSRDVRGAERLLEMAEGGLLAASLLQRPVIADAILSLRNKRLVERMRQLTSGLPDDNRQREELISTMRTRFLTQHGDILQGQKLFQKHCAVCHQVAGQGNKVGPNLDGIASRGLDRLLEDVLAPDRNVDIAFRATTVVRTDGRIATGFSKGFDGQRLILVDQRGKEIAIPQDEIEERVVSRRSPMPDNLAGTMTSDELRHLMAWLLTLQR